MFKLIAISTAAVALSAYPLSAKADVDEATSERIVEMPAEHVIAMFAQTPDVEPKQAADCRFAFAVFAAVGDTNMLRTAGDDQKAARVALDRGDAWMLVLLREARRTGEDASRVKGRFERRYGRNGMSSRFDSSGGILGKSEKMMRKCDAIMFGDNTNSLRLEN